MANIQGMTPEQLIAMGASDPRWLAQLTSDNEKLGAMIVSGDVPTLRKYLMNLYMKASHKQYEANKEMEEIARDPDNPEHQRKIEAAIRQQNIEQNLEAAYENMPEAFGRICMLYVNVQINGNPTKAFVDSGAQMTIMSQQMAERMGILRLMDTRYAGTAKGVGTSKILGRVHIAQMKFGNTFMPISVTILENNDMDFLFGLDNLRRYRCCIDLSRNCLRIDGSNGPEEVPFLSEHELEGVDSNFNNPQADMKVSGEASATSSSSVPSAGGSSSNSSSALNSSNPTATSSSSSAMMDVETTSNSHSNGGITNSAVAASPSDLTEKIEQLIALGFPRTDAEMALNQADGDVNLAATILFAQQG